MTSIPSASAGRWTRAVLGLAVFGSLTAAAPAQPGSAATGSLLPGEIPQTTVVHAAPTEPGWQITKGPGHHRLPEMLKWDRPPRLAEPIPPVYPYEKLVADEPGEVIVRFIIGPAGRVSEHEILAATAPEFSAAVAALLDALSFAPATRKGAPCHAVVQMRFDFDTHPNRPVESIGSGSQNAQLVRHDFGGAGRVNPYFADRQFWRDLNSGKIETCPAGQVEEAPRLLARTPPAYPPAMAKLRREGAAEVEIVVDRLGRVRLPQVLSATDPAFGYAAVQAVARWQFEPARSRGNPVVVHLRVPVEFRLPAPAGG